MIYFKWMYEDEPIIERIPGFVFCSKADALIYLPEFKGWVSRGWAHGVKRLNLYRFEGTDPIEFPLLFTSDLIHRGAVGKLSSADFEAAMRHFAVKPCDYFTLAASEVDLDLLKAVCATAGSLKPTLCQDQATHGHAAVEAYYAWPAMMIKNTDPDVVAALMLGD